MFDRLSRKLVISKFGKTTYGYGGMPQNKNTDKITVNEPIVSSQNPNTVYTNSDAGQYSVTTLYWISRHGEFNKGDKVQDDTNEYVVTAKADVLDNLHYYTIKKVGD